MEVMRYYLFYNYKLMERNICYLQYCNALWNWCLVTVSYRKSTAEFYQPRYYEIIVWEWDGEKSWRMIEQDELHSVEDKEALEKAYVILLRYSI